MPLHAARMCLEKQTEICVVDGEDCRLWRGKCASRPEAIAEVLQQCAPAATRVGMATGLLAVWLWHGLKALGVPIECLHARHVAAALALQVNKANANDALGIAPIVRSGWYVAVKSLRNCRIRASLSAHRQLVMVRTSLYNQIRGLLKTFGMVLGVGISGTFEGTVHAWTTRWSRTP